MEAAPGRRRPHAAASAPLETGRLGQVKKQDRSTLTRRKYTGWAATRPHNPRSLGPPQGLLGLYRRAFQLGEPVAPDTPLGDNIGLAFPRLLQILAVQPRFSFTHPPGPPRPPCRFIAPADRVTPIRRSFVPDSNALPFLLVAQLQLPVQPPPNKILLIRPSALGDVCRTVPVVAGLRLAYPHAEIDWLVQEGFEDAVRGHPALTGVVSFPRKRFRRWWNPSVARDVVRYLLEIRARRYDLVLDCQGLARSGLFAWVSGAPLRVGYRDAAELGWLGLNRRIDAPVRIHTVDRMLRLVESLAVPVERDMRLYPPLGARESLAAIPPFAAALKQDDSGIGGAGRPFAVFAPTSRWRGKLWPADRFASLAQRVLAYTDLASSGS